MNKTMLRQPTAEMLIKIQNAMNAVAKQKERKVRCPACLHNTIIVFEDTRGHVKTKCNRCKSEVVIDVLNMRRPVLYFAN